MKDALILLVKLSMNQKEVFGELALVSSKAVIEKLAAENNLGVDAEDLIHFLFIDEKICVER